MKIFSTAVATALLLGIGAFVQAPAVHAEADPQSCATWEAGCQAGNLTDCKDYKSYCTGRTSLGVTLDAAPAAKSNDSKLD
ncbi:hypothetical protein [Dyella acidiphila]|uniref:Uncharacterized protein n=1 Tax=Dyella acidiphila TaxID=2775866 RepID=A0ABR9GEN8_9GAMM|nr:hypothetical protein [Dyella acidiphila]MBE1162514.1 hypothetical protein [Dyella acidiphila]